MNHLSKKLMCLTALISTVTLMGNGTTTNIVPRSQSFNAARQIVGWDDVNWGINRKPEDKWYASLNLAFEYSRTFRDNSLAYAFFGNDLICGVCDDASAIQISGSAVPSRPNNAWLADYFGLPMDFQSTVTFKPSITNYILDFSFYAGLDNWVDGLYFKIYGPYVHTRWNLNAEECVSNAGSMGYFQGYFSSNTVPVANLNTKFLNYTNGCVPSINNDNTYGLQTYCLDDEDCSPLGSITWNSLCCSKISNDCECGGASANGFAELRFILGYNFLNDEDGKYHVGIGIYVAAPTGTRVGTDDCNGEGRYLFQPIVGNGKHWELGAQVTAHHRWWESEDGDKSFGWYLEADITHLFGANQTRCFDLCSAGSNSRYMLAELLNSNTNSTPLLNTTTDSLGLQFGNQYSPVANITRREVRSTIGAQGDLAFTLAYRSGNFQWDLGYNFWGRSCENLCIQDDCCAQPIGKWALKGDQRVYGFDGSLAVSIPATNSQANIHTGSNLCNGANYTIDSNPTNFYGDNPTAAFGGFINTDTSTITNLPLNSTQIYTSEKPVMISECDFNLTGTRGISNKIFTHLNWAWADRDKDCKWTPYVGVGAEVEFGSSRDNDCCEASCNTGCNTTCNTGCNTGYYNNNCSINTCSSNNCCSNVALSQWGVWFKVGTSYN